MAEKNEMWERRPVCTSQNDELPLTPPGPLAIIALRGIGTVSSTVLPGSA